MSVTNYEWVQRFLRPHDSREHLRASSLRYRGNHVFINYWDRHVQEIATIVTCGDRRAIFLHNPEFAPEQQFNYAFNCVAKPLNGWYYGYRDLPFPQVYRVIYHHGESFEGKTDAEIIDTMQHRLEDTIKQAYDNRAQCVRKKFRQHAMYLCNSYEALIKELKQEQALPTSVGPMVKELLELCADTPENQHKWRAMSREQATKTWHERREARERAKIVQREIAADTVKFTAWLQDQPYPVVWELLTMTRIVQPAWAAQPDWVAQHYPEAADFRHRIGDSAFYSTLVTLIDRERAVAGYKDFVTAFIDPIGSLPSLFRLSYYCGPSVSHTEINTGHLDVYIRGLADKVLPKFPSCRLEGVQWSTQSVDNVRWIIQGGRYTSVLSALNVDYLRERLIALKKQVEATSASAD